MRGQIRQVKVAQLPTPLPADLLVLDVREPQEWDAGHIDGAVHVPLMDLPQRLDDISDGSQVLVVCRVGARSAHATAFLEAQGRDAVNLHGGLIAWEAAGLPLVSTGAGLAVVL